MDVYKSLTIKSTSGNPTDTIVQAKSPDDHVFEVTADYVNISGFTITGATNEHGLYLPNADYCNISKNNISKNNHGIWMGSSSTNTIIYNSISSNANGAIIIFEGSNNTIANNKILDTKQTAIGVSKSNNNTF